MQNISVMCAQCEFKRSFNLRHALTLLPKYQQVLCGTCASCYNHHNSFNDLVLMLTVENRQTWCLWLACWHPYDIHSRFLKLSVSVQNSVMLEPILCWTASWIHATYARWLFCI